MFEDLIPSASAPTPALPPGMFDDLIPAAGAGARAREGITAAPRGPDGLAPPRSTAGTDAGSEKINVPEPSGQPRIPFSGSPNIGNESSPPRGLFDDLIPAAASGGAAGRLLRESEPQYQPIPDRWLGLKDATTGIPLVREGKPGRFIAEVAGEDDGGLFWKDPQTGEIRRPGLDQLIRPEGGKFKVYERHEVVRPWTVSDMALIRAIVSGFTAPRDAFAGNMAPHEVIPRALDSAALVAPGTTFTPWRARPRAEPQAAEPPPEPQPRSLSAASPDSGAGVLGLGERALEGARGSLREMFEAARRKPPADNTLVDLGSITPEGAARVNALLNEAGVDLDVSGFRHVVDAYAARHVFKEHGAAVREAQRGQAPITSEDWAMIPDVLSSPDGIAYVGRTAIGREGIGYWKRIDGSILYIEEVRTGRKTLAAVTMEKFKSGTEGISGVPGRPNRLAPPRSTAGTDPGTE